MPSETNKAKTPAEERADRVGHYVKEWRIHRGLSQKEVADRMKFSNAALSQLEKGWTTYRQEMLEELATALNCRPSDLLRPPQEVEMERYFIGLENDLQRAQMLEIMKSIAGTFFVQKLPPRN